MEPATTMHDLIWWITVIEIPVMTGLFGFMIKTRQDLELSLQKQRDALSALRVDMARNYAQTSSVRELENRLTSHLLRIEAKLDITSVKAEVLSAKSRKEKS